MDDRETLRRRARLRELIRECFDGKAANLIRFISEKTRKSPNQGELSAIQIDNGGKPFGDKKAKTLTEQIGLPRRWFDMPLGECLKRDEWSAWQQESEHNAALVEKKQASSINSVLSGKYISARKETKEIVDYLLEDGARRPKWVDDEASAWIQGLKYKALTWLETRPGGKAKGKSRNSG
jgi:hypothetical protein